MSACKIIFLNQKGGVGKTTTCVNLGSSLAEMGNKVLLIDFDSQGNLTGAVSGDSRKPTIYNVIAGEISAKDAVQETPFDNLFVIPGSVDLAGLNLELVSEEDREYYLKNSISSLDDEFDFILLDCPPSLGLLTMNALAWAEYVFIPMQCEYFAMEGLNMLMRTITSVRKNINKDLKILGILFTMFTKRARLNAEVIEDVSTFFPNLVFKTIIPRTIRLAEAPSHGLPISAYDSRNSGNKAYQNLAKEVISRV
ncbi:MAG: ParA family protein [Sphaerochaetaceae bacterium]|nr:ParA family protein [Sphaerochaetaceae bacterium]